MTKFHLTVLTQEGKVFDDDIVTVTLPGTDGYFGVLAHHAPMVSMLGDGLLTIQTGEKDLQGKLSGGFSEVADNTMTILADSLTELKEL